MEWLIAFAPGRVITTHSTPFQEEDATERLRRSVAPLLHGRAAQRVIIAAAAGAAAPPITARRAA